MFAYSIISAASGAFVAARRLAPLLPNQFFLSNAIHSILKALDLRLLRYPVRIFVCFLFYNRRGFQFYTLMLSGMGIVVVDFFLPLGKVSGAGLLGSVGVAGSASCVTGNGNYRLISPEARSARRPDMNFRYEQFGVRNWTSSASACIQPTAAAAAATVARRRRLSRTSRRTIHAAAQRHTSPAG